MKMSKCEKLPNCKETPDNPSLCYVQMYPGNGKHALDFSVCDDIQDYLPRVLSIGDAEKLFDLFPDHDIWTGLTTTADEV